ncbi:helix-turn-helix domain-containing protein [Williamsia deligens]|uniref:Helix-turn-helix domain-containing protein n=1 Tax=Williamsia deligens TaxID=321325 RepID=A0ABW3GBW6_9NOCA|nr:helix-turn-helix domain-containing protein [Williamsia deligens]MCP2195121.1 transcriptional regulator, IclR family [Williamsia deligens]
MSAFGGDGGARSVINALELLEEVAASGPGVTAIDLARSLGLSRSTTYRLVNLLAQEEYLVRTPDLGGFALGRKLDRLVGVASAAPVTDQVRAVLDDARGGLRFGLHLFGYLRPGTSRARITLLDIDPDYPLSDPSRILHDHTSSAVGRLLLTYETSDPARTIGFATQTGSFVPGFGCLALPVLSPEGHLRAALSVSAPEHRITHPTALIESLQPTRLMLDGLLAHHAVGPPSER